MDWEVWIVAGSLLALAAAVGLTLFSLRRTRRTLYTLEQMLDDAARGQFRETRFDESRLSALETRMAHYLSASSMTSGRLEQEQAAIKALIGDISHQTKTPIANLQLYSQLLAEQELPQESRTCVAALSEQVSKLRFLIDALVKTSRLETGVLTLSPRLQNISPLLERTAAQAAPGASAKGISLIVEPTELTARFDERWTAEALYNLVDNAVKYTPAGGRVTLRAVGYELFCRIDVTDTGPGIPEDEQPRIFGRFYRSTAARGQEGVGIGLYLSRQIAQREGGYLRVSSRPGAGSTFSLFLPREEPPAVG